MVTLLLDSALLEVDLSPVEHGLTLRKHDIDVPRDQISRVMLTDDPWTWIRGVRAPGTGVPGVVAAGTFRSPSSRDFVLVRGRRRPGVVIELDGHDEFQRIILTMGHGPQLVQALHLDTDDRPRDVVDLATGAIAQIT